MAPADLLRAWPLLMIGGVDGCLTTPPPAASYEVVVEVQGDPGQPLAGAWLRWGEQDLGGTGPNGTLALRIRGTPGRRVAISVDCPEGFESPAEPLTFGLRIRTSDPSSRPRLQARCPPTLRDVVVAVRAEGGAGLPVRHLGEEVARTNRFGVAHVHLRLPPGQELELELDTRMDPDLSPTMPSATFEVGEQDAVFLFDQKLTRKARPKPPPGPRPKGPERI